MGRNATKTKTQPSGQHAGGSADPLVDDVNNEEVDPLVAASSMQSDAVETDDAPEDDSVEQTASDGEVGTEVTQGDPTGPSDSPSAPPDIPSDEERLGIFGEEFILTFGEGTRNEKNIPTRVTGHVGVRDIHPAGTVKGIRTSHRAAARRSIAADLKTVALGQWSSASPEEQTNAIRDDRMPSKLSGIDRQKLRTNALVHQYDVGAIATFANLNPEPVPKKQSTVSFMGDLVTVKAPKDKEPTQLRVGGMMALQPKSIDADIDPTSEEILRGTAAVVLTEVFRARYQSLGNDAMADWPAMQTEARTQLERTATLFELEIVRFAPFTPKFGEDARAQAQSEDEAGANRKAESFEPPGEPVAVAFRTPKFEVTESDKTGPVPLVVHGTMLLKPLDVEGELATLSDAQKAMARRYIQGMMKTAVQDKVANQSLNRAAKDLVNVAMRMPYLSTAAMEEAGAKMLSMQPVLAQGAAPNDVAEPADAESGLGEVDEPDEGPSLLDDVPFDVLVDLERRRAKVRLKRRVIPGTGITITGGEVTAKMTKRGTIKRIEQGSLCMTVAFDGVDTLDAKLANVEVTKAGKVSGDGSVTLLTDTAPIKSGDLSFSVMKGSTGTAVFERNVLREIKTGANMKVTATEGGTPLLELTVAKDGRLYDRLRKLDVAATAKLLRFVSLSSGLGPLGTWTVGANPADSLNVTLAENKLESLSGSLNVGVEDASGPFLNISMTDGTFENTKEFAFSFSSPMKAEITQPAHLFDMNGYSFWLNAGTGITADVQQNAISGLGGKVPFLVREGDEPLIDVTVEGGYQGKSVSGSGSATLRRPFRVIDGLGPDRNWGLSVLDDTSVTATFDNNAFTGMSGSIHVALFNGADQWLSVSGQGAYEHPTSTFTSTGALDFAVKKEQVIARPGSDVLTLLKDTGAKIDIQSNQIQSIEGKLGVKYTAGGIDRFKFEAEGGYDANTHMAHGDGKVTVLSDFDKTALGATFTIKKDSDAGVSFEDNDVKRITGNLGVRMHKDTFDADIEAKNVAFDVPSATMESFDGSVTLRSDWQPIPQVKFTKIDGSVNILNNEVVAADGTLEGQFFDEQGMVAYGTVSGGFKNNKAHGLAKVRLARTVDINLGGGVSAKIYGKSEASPTSLSATLVDGELASMTGKTKVDVFKGARKLFGVHVNGTYNVKSGALEKLYASVVIPGPFTFLDDRAEVRQLTSTVFIQDDKLKMVEGSAEFDIGLLNIHGGSLEFAWRTTDSAELWSFNTTIEEWVLFDSKNSDGEERSLKGKMDLNYKEDDSFTATVGAKYKMNDDFQVDATVDVDNKLDPVITEASTSITSTLTEGSTLFDWDKELFDIHFHWGPIFVGGGIDIGASLFTRPLIMKGDFSIKDYHPALGETPDFDLNFGGSWGVDLALRLGVDVSAGVSFKLAGVEIGVEAGLELKVPIDVNPAFRLVGDDQGFGGAFAPAISIEPALELYIRPYFEAWAGPWDTSGYFGSWDFDLAKFGPFGWTDTYQFGDRKTPVIPKPSAGKPGSKKKDSNSKSAPKSKRNDKSTPAKLPGGGELSADSLLGKMKGNDSGNGNSLLKKAIDMPDWIDRII